MTQPDPPTAELCIIICTHNRADRLQGTLDSLAALTSSRTWEVLFVDNASTDNTADVLAKADDLGGRLRVVHVARKGLGAARDAAWRMTEAPIIAFTDDDCYVAPDYVDQILEVFDQHKEIGVLGGRIMLYDPQDVRVTIDERDTAKTYPPRIFLRPGQLHGANLSFRRSALAAVDGLDPRLGAGSALKSSEDIDAATAVLWAGFEGRFDPRPVVHHHHGRKEADVPGIFASYDFGRGVLFAKYWIRPDTRWTYLRTWVASLWKVYDRETARRMRLEMQGALRFAAVQGGVWPILLRLMFLPLALGACTLWGLRAARNRVLGRG